MDILSMPHDSVDAGLLIMNVLEPWYRTADIV